MEIAMRKNYFDTIQKLGKHYRENRKNPITAQGLFTERCLRRDLMIADMNEALWQYGARADEEIGDLRSIALRLLEEYCMMRGCIEDGDAESWLEEGETIADFKDQAENIFYAAECLLTFSDFEDDWEAIPPAEYDEFARLVEAYDMVS